MAISPPTIETPADAKAPAARAVGRFRAWLQAPSDYDGIFPPRMRRLGLLYTAFMIPAVTALSVLATTKDTYLLMWSLPALVTCGTPCTIVSILAMRRAPVTTTDRPAYLLWLGAVIIVALIGFGLVIGVVTHSNVGDPLGPPAVVAIALLLIGGIVRLTRSRSGQRTFSVDMIEAVMAVTVVVAPFVLLWGADTLHTDEAWYTIPAGIAFVGFTFGIYWVVALVVRMGPNAGPIEWCGIAFTVFGAANAGLQVAQGISGFDLPAPPLIFVQACCAGAAVLVPLNLRRKPLPGLEVLPPQAQVRVGYIATLLTLAGLPVMIVVGTAVDERISWAPPFTLGVAATLVLLIGLRQLAGINETRRLYAHIEHAADQRRLLLAQVMRRANEERHRVASELHQQAVAAYTSVVSLVGAYRSVGNDRAVAEAASHQVRDDLAEQVEAARHLMQAIKPLELGPSRSRDLAAPIQAYIDNLYGDDPTPQLSVSCDPDLYLDWSTETIALRIIQEALRNVWEHSKAGEVGVSIDAVDGAAVVEVADDGVGFDPSALGDGDAPGIAAMRVFATAIDGSVDVESTVGEGTTVIARLGGEATTTGIAPIVQLRG